MNDICPYFLNGFREALKSRQTGERRVGAELKFPLVNPDGTAASFETVCALWDFLQERGWTPVEDTSNGQVVGARIAGEQNDTMASCETGYCKTEFSMAHAGSLFDLEKSIDALSDELRRFAERHNVRFLCYGIHPVTPPGKHLLMKKSRTSVWDKVFPSNRHISSEHGDDFHLFTINAASHVHVSVGEQEAIPAVNVLNGFAGAQLALTAHSNIWKGGVDARYKCVAEKFWDWWMPDSQRVGMPAKPFKNVEDYVDTVSQFKPVFVRRGGKPVVLTDYDSFADYYSRRKASGRSVSGEEIELTPAPEDIDVHSTCYWYNARVSRYYTVENRANDQQPPGELLCIAALTLGLVCALPESEEEILSYDWQHLRRAREAACESGLDAEENGVDIKTLARRMVSLAENGLRKRGLGEQQFLEPFRKRLAANQCPADGARALFENGGIEELVDARSL